MCKSITISVMMVYKMANSGAMAYGQTGNDVMAAIRAAGRTAGLNGEEMVRPGIRAIISAADKQRRTTARFG